jgi:flagellar motor switch/type III secretory pathway protein FliN
MNELQHDNIGDFFQVFTRSVTKTLSKSLDTDICKKINFSMESLSAIQNVEKLKDNNAIYKIDYATGNNQGALVILIPEELIAIISDVLTGGTGEGAYKGSLSEIETNSILNILEKIFKNIEVDFKKHHEHNLAFSAEPILLLKEMPEYSINEDNASFDFSISNILSLNPDNDFAIDLLTSFDSLEKFMDDLGFSKQGGAKKKGLMALDLKCLSDVKIQVTAELGRTRVPIKHALELVRGSLVQLNTVNNSDIKVFANGIEFASAQVVAIEDSFGLKITRIISQEERLEHI